MSQVVLFSQVRFKNSYHQLSEAEREEFLAKVRSYLEEERINLISEYKFLTGEYEKFLVYELENITSLDKLQKKFQRDLNYKLYLDIINHIGYKTN